jgi:hypothetical protein
MVKNQLCLIQDYAINAASSGGENWLAFLLPVPCKSEDCNHFFIFKKSGRLKYEVPKIKLAS